jgi:tRNA(Arg) A34 adenosine deaminase TadA
MMQEDEYWMRQALLLADVARSCGEVPVGALVVLNGEVIGKGWNQPISLKDPSAHAEIMALRDACQYIKNYRLPDAALYVTLEPCSMCAGAIIHSRVKRLIYGASEPKAGVVASQTRFFDQSFLNHSVEISGGILAEQSAKKLQDFFQYKRQQYKLSKE